MTFEELKALVMEWKLAHDADREGASARVKAINNLRSAAIDLLDERYGKGEWDDF